MSGSDVIFIIGRQRSGTTVFRDLLSRHGAVNCDEIFHGEIDRPHRFYKYLLEKIDEDKKYVHPQFHPDVFDKYISSELEAANGRKLAIDVKYFAINLIPSREDVDNSKPYILKYIQREGAKVVHIVRRNKLRVYISEELSKKTGLWSVEKKEQFIADKPRLHIDVNAAIRFISEQEHQDQKVCDLFLGHAEKTVYYDEMFNAEGLFTESVRLLASSLLGVEEIDVRPGNLKMNPEKIQHLVSNYEELEKQLIETKYSWMLSDMN